MFDRDMEAQPVVRKNLAVDSMSASEKASVDPSS